jgi:hypothetical protein
MLFINGTNDFAYFPDSWSKSTQLPKGPVQRSFTINLPHGHIFTFKEVDTFIDSILLKDTKPLATVTTFQPGEDNKTVVATFQTDVPIVQAELIWTSDEGEWPKREWQSTSATIGEAADGGKVSVTLPAENPKAYCLVLTDERSLRVSSQVIIL